ncbi:MAG: DsrE family protein [Rhodocyclaceae bacterium]|nr:DsrE family protein [Rhodocyclaceae bacterium]
MRATRLAGAGLAATIIAASGCAVLEANHTTTEAAKAARVAAAPVKVIYHVSEGTDQATNALRNIRNHLSADPTAKISVVTHANGIDFLLDGAKDKNGNDYVSNVQELVKRGVDFRVCKLTLERRNIDPKRVIEEARLVPSGVAEVARLQAREGYVYLKP